MDQVATEVQPEVKQETTIAQANTIPESQVVAPVADQESEKDINWKKFKAARDADRKKAEEMTQRYAEKEAEALAMKNALEALVNKPNGYQQQQNYSNNGFDAPEETEDQRIEKKVLAAIQAREAERDRLNHEKSMQEYPNQLRRDFNDFDQVIGTNNLDYLDYHYPEVARAFSHMPEGYEKWASVYKAVKRFVPNTDTKKDNAKIEKNLSKPQAMHSTQTPSGGHVIPNWKELEKQRADRYRQMQAKINSMGT